MIAGVICVNFILFWYSKYTTILEWISKFSYVGKYIHLEHIPPWSGCIAALLVFLYLAYCLIKYIVHKISLKVKAKNRRKELLASKTGVISTLNNSEATSKWEALLSLSREEYIKGLSSGDISLKDVCKAYQYASSLVDKESNAIVQFVPNATEIAGYIMRNRVGSKKLLGYVLFVSENIPVKYCSSTHGLVSMLSNSNNAHDCPAIKVLKNHGALPLVTTNVAQHFGLSTSNPIVGQTTIWGREPGGDSGGAAVLVSGIQSDFAVGVGLDVWGSLRMASAFSGCFTLKPTFGRHLTTEGTLNTDDYLANHISNITGYMTSSMSTLKHFWEVTWSTKIKDYNIQNMPWKNIYPKRGNLRIGFFTRDNALDPDPSCVRAVRQACSSLRANGHSVMEFPSPDMQEVMQLYLGHLNVQKMVSELSVDLASVDSLYYFYYFSLVPQSLKRNFISYFYQRFVMGIPLAYPTESIDRYLEVKNRARVLKREYLRQWDMHGIDVLLTPGSLTPTPTTHLAKNFSPLALPYIPWNLMNLPAGIVPVGRVNQEDVDKSNKLNLKTYNYIRKAKSRVGLPLTVQVVGRPFEEEKVLYAMEELSSSRQSE